MKIKGRAWKFRDDINTDEIIPARFLNTSDPEELGRYCMAGIDEDFVKKMKKGDIIVAGKNFGCGSSREHAPVSIKGAGVSCVIAESFARIFYRNAINIGLPIIELKNASKEINGGDELEIDLDKGLIKNRTTGREYAVSKFPGFMEEIISAGGLLNWANKLK